MHSTEAMETHTAAVNQRFDFSDITPICANDNLTHDI